MKKESEFYYYPIFRKWLKNIGYSKTFQQVKFLNNIEIDIVGVKFFKTVPPKIACIEVKLFDWNKVLHQAYLRSFFFDYSYLALIYDNPSRLSYIMYKFAETFEKLTVKPDHRIGVLIYDKIRDVIIEVLTAKRNKNPQLKYKNYVLNQCLKPTL